MPRGGDAGAALPGTGGSTGRGLLSAATASVSVAEGPGSIGRSVGMRASRADERSVLWNFPYIEYRWVKAHPTGYLL